MMIRILLPILIASAVSAVPAAESPDAPAPAGDSSTPCRDPGPEGSLPAIQLDLLMKGLESPVAMAHAGDGTGRLFFVEQRGTIRVWDGKRLPGKPFLDIRDRVAAGGEKGLLGLAFHPEYPRNRRFFVNYTSRSGGLHTVISEFKAGSDPEAADRESETILMTVAQPYANHNGGQIAFGPEGALYIGTGDGGAANDPHGHGQNLSSRLGKILRIDVDRRSKGRPYGIPPDNPFADPGSDAPEVWAYGLRNPWRFSFDSSTGLLYAGDVGQNDREEIDLIRKGGNYGWNIMEGSICTPGVDPECDPKPFESPLYDYPRSEGTVVIGGHVYRGRSLPELCGVYVYGDFGNGGVFGLRHNGKTVTSHRKLLATRLNISSFGQDEQGELYVLDLGGTVHKIVPPANP